MQSDALTAARALARAWAAERQALERELQGALHALDQAATALVDTVESFEQVEQYLAADTAAEETCRVLRASVAAAWERVAHAGITADGAAAETVDLSRHRIIRETGAGAEGARLVVDVISRGVVCGGRRLRPAQVTATREGADGRENRD